MRFWLEHCTWHIGNWRPVWPGAHGLIGDQIWQHRCWRDFTDVLQTVMNRRS